MAMKNIILSGRSENKYSSPEISIIQIETETVLCVSTLDFGWKGRAGSDIYFNDIEEGGEF